MVFGGTVGVGILRLPGTLAAALGDSRLIVLFWIVGGLYALLGATAVAELAAMMPEAGGFYVYARRAFGKGPGFVVGWSDWLNQTASIAYAALTASTFLGTLWPATAAAPGRPAINLVIAVFTAMRAGRTAPRQHHDAHHQHQRRSHAAGVGGRLLPHRTGGGIRGAAALDLGSRAAAMVARHDRGSGHRAALGARDLRRLVLADLRHGGRKHAANPDAAARADRRHPVGGRDVRDHQRRDSARAAAAGARGLGAAGRRCRPGGAAARRRRAGDRDFADDGGPATWWSMPPCSWRRASCTPSAATDCSRARPPMSASAVRRGSLWRSRVSALRDSS